MAPTQKNEDRDESDRWDDEKQDQAYERPGESNDWERDKDDQGDEPER